MSVVAKIAKRRKRQAGSVVVEFALVLLPLLAFLFMMMDLTWIFFGWACIQEGSRQGVRYAVTGSGTAEATLDSATKLIVQQYSFGFAKPANIHIDYYPSTGYSSSGSPASLDGTPGATSVPNIVTITVTTSLGTFGSIFRTWAAVNVTASASDVMQ